MDWQGMNEKGHMGTGLEAVATVQVRNVVVMQRNRKCWRWDTNPNLTITVSEYFMINSMCLTNTFHEIFLYSIFCM